MNERQNKSLVSLFRVHDSFLNLKVITKEQTSDTLTKRFKIHPFTFGDD